MSFAIVGSYRADAATGESRERPWPPRWPQTSRRTWSISLLTKPLVSAVNRTPVLGADAAAVASWAAPGVETRDVTGIGAVLPSLFNLGSLSFLLVVYHSPWLSLLVVLRELHYVGVGKSRMLEMERGAWSARARPVAGCRIPSAPQGLALIEVSTKATRNPAA